VLSEGSVVKGLRTLVFAEREVYFPHHAEQAGLHNWLYRQVLNTLTSPFEDRAGLERIFSSRLKAIGFEELDEVVRHLLGRLCLDAGPVALASGG